MDRFACMRTFIEVARLNGFSAAARSLDLPRSKVSKQVQALEAQLGVQLLMRTTRRIHLTEAGASYYEAAQELLADLERAEDLAREGVASIQGTLRINASTSFGLRVLGPLLPRFHERHPQVELQVALDDQLVDPIRGGFDLTIRIADLPDSGMIARTLMPAPRWVIASPDYLSRNGTPQTADDLGSHQWLGYGRLGAGSAIHLSRDSERVRVPTAGPMSSDSGELLAMMAEAGMGITLLPQFIAAEAVAAGRLVRVLADWSAPPIAVHALHASSRLVPMKTRAFIEFLQENLDPGNAAVPDR